MEKREEEFITIIKDDTIELPDEFISILNDDSTITIETEENKVILSVI